MQDKLKIVVVDDIPEFANNLKKIIEKNPRVEKVWTSNDGGDAVVQIMDVEPDIAFLDMEMPKKNGLQVMEAIYWYPCMDKYPKFVLLTATCDANLYEKARELEFDFEIVHKPFDFERIHKCIDEFVPMEIDEDERKRKAEEEAKEIEEVRKELRMLGFLKRKPKTNRIKKK